MFILVVLSFRCGLCLARLMISLICLEQINSSMVIAILIQFKFCTLEYASVPTTEFLTLHF